MENFTIGKLARLAGLGVETLRYYERRGLIAPESRTASGYRLYHSDARQRLRFIRRAQSLGFSLDEVSELLLLSDTPGETAAQVRQLALTKIADIESRIRDLERMKSALSELARHCPGHEGTAADCPILWALNQNEPESAEEVHP